MNRYKFLGKAGREDNEDFALYVKKQTGCMELFYKTDDKVV